MEIEKSCCITGRRKIPLACQEHVLHLLKKKVQEALCDGFRCFLSGFADGADLYFAKLVAEKKEEYPDIQLVAAIPYRQRLNKLQQDPEILKILNEDWCHIEVCNESYHRGVFAKRNRYLVEHAQRVIAVYDDIPSGGTYSTIRMAEKLNRDIHYIPFSAETDSTPQ